MKDLSDWKTNSMQKHIPNMSRGGSQAKRKRDATTGSTAKVHYNWGKGFDEQFGGLEGDTIDKYDLEAIKSFLTKCIQESYKAGREEEHQKLLDILEHNKDPMTGLYDFDGIALEVINLVKK